MSSSVGLIEKPRIDKTINEFEGAILSIKHQAQIDFSKALISKNPLKEIVGARSKQNENLYLTLKRLEGEAKG